MPSQLLEAAEFTSASLREDKDFILQAHGTLLFGCRKALESSGHILQFASEALRCDREVVLRAVRKDGCAVRHAFYQSFREDFEVMKEAQNGSL